MLTSEGLKEISEDPTSELGDDPDFDDDEIEELRNVEVENENDLRDANDPVVVNEFVRSPAAKSIRSSALSDGRRSRAKERDPFYSFGTTLVKRDPAIESIIESRKHSTIDNSYTRLAKATSHAPRQSQRVSQFEMPQITESDYETEYRTPSDRSVKKASLLVSSELENDEWNDGLVEEFEKEVTTGPDKACLQIYEETCAHFNICPCSMIVRSIGTTEINLRNYGLGPRGCSALAAALVRNVTVVTLNLSGNNIGSHGMSYMYQVLLENISIENYDLSYNNLGTKGIIKLADALTQNLQTKTLSVAGNKLNATDIRCLLLKLEEHPNLKSLNLSHNQLDEEGGKYIAEWLDDNHVLLDLDVSWCSIRLTGAKALAKAIGDNNKLVSIDISRNSFSNDTLEILTNSLTRNVTLCELNLHGNQFLCRYAMEFKQTPTDLTTGKDSQIYKLLVAATTNQSLKILRFGQNHIDVRCLIIMLEALAQLTDISAEELDLTGLSITPKQILQINSLFLNHSKLKCYVGPVRQTTEHFTNHLLNLVDIFCQDNNVTLSDLFNPNDGIRTILTTITFEQFLNGLRKAKIPIPGAYIDDIMKYLEEDGQPGIISIKSIDIA